MSVGLIQCNNNRALAQMNKLYHSLGTHTILFLGSIHVGLDIFHMLT